MVEVHRRQDGAISISRRKDDALDRVIYSGVRTPMLSLYAPGASGSPTLVDPYHIWHVLQKTPLVCKEFACGERITL